MKKGFSARERKGLIVFCTVVIFFLAIGPVAERCGCTSISNNRSDAMVGAGTQPVTKDSVHEEGALNRQTKSDGSSDSIRIKKSVEKSSKGGRGRKKSNKKSVDPQRRRYLDEPL